MNAPSPGAFRARTDEAASVLGFLDLVAYREPRPNYSQALTRRARSAPSYAAEWTIYSANSGYDIRLNDNSLLRFVRQSEGNTLLSYSYIECPFDVLDYDSFVVRELGQVDAHREFWVEYDDYVAQAPLKAHVVPLRFDWSPNLYRVGAHPSGHLHVGVDNEMRLGCAYVMQPLAFAFLVLRQRYPMAWAKLLASDRKPNVDDVRGEAVAAAFVQADDLLELYLK